jgi:hypothetical protein
MMTEKKEAHVSMKTMLEKNHSHSEIVRWHSKEEIQRMLIRSLSKKRHLRRVEFNNVEVEGETSLFLQHEN